MNYITLFSCIHGSKLHGTSGPGSDTDIKGVYALPTLDEYMITRGKAYETLTWNNGLTGPSKEECEFFYIQDMANHLGKMQTNHVSMVFCPKELWLESSPAWEELVKHKDKVVSKKISAYAGYCKSQANRYTLKGDRYQTCLDFMLYLDRNFWTYRDNPKGRMTEEQWEAMKAEFQGREGVEFWTNQTGEDLVRVVAKSFSKTTEVYPWQLTMEKLLREYGDRAKKANQDGQDIKAVYHAFRITKEAQEILTTGELRYPSEHVPLYMKIRNGEFSFETLQEMIIEELDVMNALQATSTLPDEPDHKWLQDWARDYQRELWAHRR